MQSQSGNKYGILIKYSNKSLLMIKYNFLTYYDDEIPWWFKFKFCKEFSLKIKKLYSL